MHTYVNMYMCVDAYKFVYVYIAACVYCTAVVAGHNVTLQETQEGMWIDAQRQVKASALLSAICRHLQTTLGASIRKRSDSLPSFSYHCLEWNYSAICPRSMQQQRCGLPELSRALTTYFSTALTLAARSRTAVAPMMLDHAAPGILCFSCSGKLAPALATFQQHRYKTDVLPFVVAPSPRSTAPCIHFAISPLLVRPTSQAFLRECAAWSSGNKRAGINAACFVLSYVTHTALFFPLQTTSLFPVYRALKVFPQLQFTCDPVSCRQSPFPAAHAAQLRPTKILRLTIALRNLYPVA